MSRVTTPRRSVMFGAAVAILIAAPSCPGVSAQPPRPPIIDVHMHASRADDMGPPPMAMCAPGIGFQPLDPRRPWPMIDDLLAVLWAHPQVYVDTGVISFALPRAEFHRYLQRIVEAGFGTRVMFGSDQMVWPGAIERAIESIETAAFLSPDQKRDILFNNAVRFFRLTNEQIASLTGK